MPTCTDEDCQREHEASMVEIETLRANCSRVVEEMERLWAALSTVTRMRVMPDDRVNRITLSAAIKMAENVLGAFEHPAPKSDQDAPK